MRSFATGSGNGNGSSPRPPVAAVEPSPAASEPGASAEPPAEPTDVEAARLAEEESRPDGTDGGAVTP
jgi:hypothetical protein